MCPSCRLRASAPSWLLLSTSSRLGTQAYTEELPKQTIWKRKQQNYLQAISLLRCYPPGVKVTGKDLGGQSEERKERVREEMFPASLQLLVYNMAKQRLGLAWLGFAQLGWAQLRSGHPQLLRHPQG